MAFGLLWRWETWQKGQGKEPVVPPDLFRNRHLTSGTVLAIVFFTVVRHGTQSGTSFVDATAAAYVNIALVVVALALTFTLPRSADST